MGIVYTKLNFLASDKTFQVEETQELCSLELNAEEKHALDQELEEPSGKTIQSILNYSKTTEFSATPSGDFKGNKN